MSSFRINKDTSENKSRTYSPPLKDSDLQGPSPYSTFLQNTLPEGDNGNNKLLLATGNPIPFIVGSTTTPSPLYNISSPSTGTYNINFTTPFTTTPILNITSSSGTGGATITPFYDSTNSTPTTATVTLSTAYVTTINNYSRATIARIQYDGGTNGHIQFYPIGSNIISNFHIGDQVTITDTINLPYNMSGTVTSIESLDRVLLNVYTFDLPSSNIINFSMFDIIITHPPVSGNFTFIATQ